MTSFLVALVATVIALWIQLAVLRRRNWQLRANEQAYKFHELRDRLQVLIVQGTMGDTSIAYKFLMWALNLAIKDAGTMALSDVVQVARAVKRKADDITFEQIAEDIRRRGDEAQALSAEFFRALTKMLISNDNLTSVMFALARPLARVLNDAAVRVIVSIGKALVPERAEALYEAREYQRWGEVLAPDW